MVVQDPGLELPSPPLRRESDAALVAMSVRYVGANASAGPRAKNVRVCMIPSSDGSAQLRELG